MNWRDQLRPASFRGVPFHALSDSATFGRRTVLHEYPFRDLPYVEDMGRRAREIRVVGFVIGDDFMVQRDAMIEAIEQAGSGKLVHPQYGELNVSITDSGVTVDHATAEGGIARISFACIESGEAKFPIAQAATQDLLKQRSGFSLQALADRFAGALNVASLPLFAVDDALGRVNEFLGQVKQIIAPIAGVTGRSGVLALVDALLPQASALLQQPLQLARQIQGIVEAVRTAMPARSAVDALGQLATFGAGELHLPPTFLGQSLVYGLGAGDVPAPAPTPTRLREAGNRDVIHELIRGSAGSARARAVADLQFTDYDDAVAVRDAVVGHLDMVADISANDAVYDALSALRAALVRDVAARGADLARLVSYTPEVTTPALVLAHRLYDDASRDADLIARNRFQHPGFVPGGVPLEVPVDA